MVLITTIVFMCNGVDQFYSVQVISLCNDMRCVLYTVQKYGMCSACPVRISFCMPCVWCMCCTAAAHTCAVPLTWKRHSYYNTSRMRVKFHLSHQFFCLLQDMLFYHLPEHCNFYSELIGCLDEGSAVDNTDGHATVTVLFNKFDSLQMQRVVGNARCSKMLKSGSSTFLYT